MQKIAVIYKHDALAGCAGIAETVEQAQAIAMACLEGDAECEDWDVCNVKYIPELECSTGWGYKWSRFQGSKKIADDWIYCLWVPKDFPESADKNEKR